MNADTPSTRPAVPCRTSTPSRRLVSRPGPLSIVASGVDTLHLFARDPVAQTWARRLDAAREESQTKAQADRHAPPARLDVAGHMFDVKPHGARTAPFLLDADQHAALLLNPTAASTFPTFVAEIRALYLWQRGARAAAAEMDTIARSVLLYGTAPDGGELHVGRCDLAVDFQGWVPEEADGVAFVTRAGDRSSHTTRRHFTGFMFGRGDVACRLYDKTAEIERSGKGWFRDVWRASGVYDPSRPVWRLEYQMRRPAIAALRLPGPGPREEREVGTWRDFSGSIAGVWRYLATRWLKLPGPRTERSRQALHPTWATLAHEGFSRGTWAGTDVDLYRAHREDAAHRMTAQIAGYLARGFAEEAFFDRGRAPGDLDHLDLDTAVPRIVARAPQYAEKHGKSIETKAEERLVAWDLARADAQLAPEPGALDPDEDDDQAEAA